jgi:glycosyltransferase involved in cell wall biosynthesis
VTEQPDAAPVVHFVVPEGIDDPKRPSGGNVYDRRVAHDLPHFGWTVLEHAVPGSWPTPEPSDRTRLDDVLARLTDGSVVLVDGLIASAAQSLVSAARRLRIVVLLHMPLAEASPAKPIARVESDVLNAAAAVITTSVWTRAWVVRHHDVPAERVWAAVPGVDPGQPAAGSTSGGNLLCVGPVTEAKGHDVMVAALAQITDLDWRCTFAGALDLEPDFVRSLTAQAERAGLADRLVLAGPLSRSALDDVRSTTDLVVSPSRREAYGMAIAEGLARGLPAIATDVGGHREAVGASDGTPPGVLVPVNDAPSLAAALRQWLTDPTTRTRWRNSAGRRRHELAGWPETARTVAAVLQRIRA